MELILETAGESHGAVLTAILAGIPAGTPVTEAYVNARLAARQRGRGSSSRQQIEKDEVVFLSGVRDGKATGNPIALQVANRDDTYKDLPAVHEPRPGHADLPGALNRGLTDARDIVERASARETAVRVAAASIAAGFLEALGVHVLGHVVSIGSHDVYGEPGKKLEAARARRDTSELHALGSEDAQEAAARAIDKAGGDGDTLGGVVEVIATDVPLGLGGHERPETKLKSTLAATLMGVQAVQGVEIGLGFRGAAMRGSDVHDAIVAPDQSGAPTRAGNNAGGIEGGMSNGQPIIVRAAMKPLATLRKRLPSVDLTTGEAAPARHERSDVTAVSRLAVIAEVVVALDLARHIRRRFGGAHIDEVREAIERHRARVESTYGRTTSS
ncbi:MAG: chorismate synthase [Planctomycetota bacterium]|nr:chorismate synthase [Planctomycetota bacterium]